MALVAGFAGLALAQAPVQDRLPRLAPYDEAQREVEYTRQYADEADARVRDAERVANEAAQARKNADQMAVEAKRRDELASRDLDNARKTAAQARTAYQQASDRFERLRKQGR